MNFVSESFIRASCSRLICCVIPLWGSATAHSPSGKEFLPSSLNQSCFSGLMVVCCSHITLTVVSLFWCSPILLIKSIYAFILLYTIWSISIVKDCRYPNILFFVWSISKAKDHHFAEECSLRLWWS